MISSGGSPTFGMPSLSSLLVFALMVLAFWALELFPRARFGCRWVGCAGLVLEPCHDLVWWQPHVWDVVVFFAAHACVDDPCFWALGRFLEHGLLSVWVSEVGAGICWSWELNSL